ncbi:MAG: TIGR01777 family oxidoreductase [Bacteroidales bacterium]|nr:MAG: TIGR01777 family oxidoreductase [Bacteroidales bacterium]
MGENNRKRLIITGATGFIGQHLYKKLKNEYEIIVFTRNIKNARKILGEDINSVYWDTSLADTIIKHVDGAFAVINLAGKNIGNRKWTGKNKANILSSRIRAGNVLSEAIKKAKNKPEVFIQASAIGYYGFNTGDEYDEMTSLEAGGFLAEVARKWESSVNIVNSGTRFIIIRLGIVLGKNGGLLDRILFPFKFFLGGYPGCGKQWVSWVHITDVVSAISFLLKNNKASGIYNITAPGPVQYKTLAKNIGLLIKRPSWMKIPKAILILFFGQRAKELLLSNIRVYPKRLIAGQFKFTYNNIREALDSIL